jgi:hypothetical protein
MSNSFVNPQNDYSHKQQSIIPSYRFTRIYPQTGGQAVTINAASQETIFEIPTRVVNFGRSSLKFVATPAAGGAGNFNWLYTDCLAGISQIQLYTRGGVFLCDLNHLERYSKIALKAFTSKQEALEMDNGAAGELANEYGMVASDYVNYTYSAADANTSSYAPVYVYVGGGNTATPVMNFEIPLSQLKHTLLALDKDLYFNEILLLKVKWTERAAWGFMSTANNNPAAGGAAAIAADIALSSVALHLALEDNLAISSGLMSKVMNGGMQTIVPYVYSHRNVPGAVVNQNVSVRINGAMGRHVKAIIHSPFDPTETLATRYLNTNINRTNVVSYYTAVDNARRMEADIVTTNNDDYHLVKSALPNTIATATLGVYRYNWFHIDKFSGDEDNSGEVVDSGLPLDTEHKWDFVGTLAANAFNHYTFVIVTRALSVSPQGIMIQ